MKRVGYVLIVVSMLWLAACGPTPTEAPAPPTEAPAAATEAPTTAPAPAECTIKLGAAVALTGKSAKTGEYTQDGYNFYIKHLNDAGGVKVGDQMCQFELVVYDDESNADTAAQLAEKLITEDKVDFLLGPYGSGNTYAVAAIAEKYQVPHVEANGAAVKIFSQGYKYTFGVLTPAPYYLGGLIDLALETDPSLKTVAILIENAAFSLEVAEGAKAYAEDKGLEVVYFEEYPAATQDVSPLLTAVKGLEPDILLGAGHLQDTILIVKQAKDVGVEAKVMGFSVGPVTPEFRDALGADADYITGSTQWSPAMQYQGEDIFGTPAEFAEMFEAEYGYEPPYHVAESAAAIFAYQRAFENAGTTDKEAVRDALADLDVMSFYGRIKFDEQGKNVYKPMGVQQNFPDGKLYTVAPADVAEKEFLYPFPGWE
jgi:branched-chain amino acid transport system substrate-binding protein